MIARVRIGPTEQWCAALRKNARRIPAMRTLVGMEVEINTTTMLVDGKLHDENCRWWEVSDKSKRKMAEIVPEVNNRVSNYICEHMLEMD